MSEQQTTPRPSWQQPFEGEVLEQAHRAELASIRSRATSSMVFGILGVYLGGIGSVVALALGYSARNQFNRYPIHATEWGAPRATIGIILGWVTYFIYLLLSAALATYYLVFDREDYYDNTVNGSFSDWLADTPIVIVSVAEFAVLLIAGIVISTSTIVGRARYIRANPPLNTYKHCSF